MFQFDFENTNAYLLHIFSVANLTKPFQGLLCSLNISSFKHWTAIKLRKMNSHTLKPNWLSSYLLPDPEYFLSFSHDLFYLLYFPGHVFNSWYLIHCSRMFWIPMPWIPSWLGHGYGVLNLPLQLWSTQIGFDVVLCFLFVLFLFFFLRERKKMKLDV